MKIMLVIPKSTQMDLIIKKTKQNKKQKKKQDNSRISFHLNSPNDLVLTPLIMLLSVGDSFGYISC